MTSETTATHTSAQTLPVRGPVEPLRREAVVSCRALVKRYGELVAVDGVTFTLESGTVTGFLGPSDPRHLRASARWGRRCGANRAAAAAASRTRRPPLPSKRPSIEEDAPQGGSPK